MSKKRKKDNGDETLPDRLFIVADYTEDYGYDPYRSELTPQAHAVIGKTVRVAEYQFIGYSDVKTEPTVEVVT